MSPNSLVRCALCTVSAYTEASAARMGVMLELTYAIAANNLDSIAPKSTEPLEFEVGVGITQRTLSGYCPDTDGDLSLA